MPELPEVETTRRSVEPDLLDAVVVSASVRRPRMLRRQPHARDFADRLVGRRIGHVGRHGKFLKTELEGDITWVT
ncbi:MAG: DNA-formamidopyrimidine glycosylase, partial [Acidimicrobiia bacterium]|nr:DNA-formamidopyrimidine glycosylase [Acidimicrobiia bacterium]